MGIVKRTKNNVPRFVHENAGSQGHILGKNFVRPNKFAKKSMML